VYWERLHHFHRPSIPTFQHSGTLCVTTEARSAQRFFISIESGGDDSIKQISLSGGPKLSLGCRRHMTNTVNPPVVPAQRAGRLVLICRRPCPAKCEACRGIPANQNNTVPRMSPSGDRLRLSRPARLALLVWRARWHGHSEGAAS
jgi:hypothetical protein